MLEILPLLSYATVMSITPGPNNIMVTASGARFGFKATLPHLAGISLGHALQVWLVCMGLGAVFNTWPVLHQALKIVGGIYLAWLAWKLFRSSGVAEGSAARPFSFLEAASFQFVNPKAWVMAITTATLFLSPNVAPWLGGLMVSTLVVLANFPSICVWALGGTLMRQWLQSARNLLIFNGTMALTLFATAVFMMRG